MAKNQSRFAEYDLLKEILPQIAQIDNFAEILQEAEKTCLKIFELPEEPIVSKRDVEMSGSQQLPSENLEMDADPKSWNSGLKTHDKLSEAQTLSSGTSSPVPPISYAKGISNYTKTKSGSLEAKDSLKHKKMYSKKRKIICKKTL